MLITVLRSHLKPETAESPPAQPRKRRRRGATLMEYAVALTLILIALIAGVQQLSQSTGGLMNNAANRTNFSNGSGGQGP
jgi:Flp pilus assembly pilin Flp